MSSRKPKIVLELITDSLRRSGVFFRRRGGIMKKAFELAKLCGVHVGVVITDVKGHLHTYRTSEKIRIKAFEVVETCENSKKRSKLFEYSNEDYPFTRVYNMKREIKRLDTRTASSIEGPDRPLLTKRITNDSKNLEGDELGIGRIQPKKHLKIEKIEQKCLRTDSFDLENRNSTKSSSQKTQKSELQQEDEEEYNCGSGYKYDHFHTINLKDMIKKLQKGTHKMSNKFQQDSGRKSTYLDNLKLFHKASNHYLNGNFDINFEDFWFCRVIIANYFSEMDSLLIRTLRKIPLTQMNEFVSLSKLENQPNQKNPADFIQTLLLHLEVIMLIITDRIPIKKDFKFSKEVKKLTKPTKYFAFKKWLRKRCGYLKTVYAMNSTGLGNIFNISNHSTNDDHPKRITFNVAPEVTEAHVEVFKYFFKKECRKTFISGEDLMFSLALNEICFYGEFSRLDKEFLRTLDVGSTKRFEEFEKGFLKIDVSDIDNPSTLSAMRRRNTESDFLVDLRSRRSMNSASLAQFSFEG